ncbi:MAG: response regulator [Deltaproteobacteria bacterium]|nr:response regulator [Deltaproteobacteria bacterium]
MGQVKVMVVEDEIIIARDIQMSLENMGYEVTGVVSTGNDAVESARRDIPDLVLMDIELQGEMDGTEAARKINSTLDIPVIYITAYADSAVLERAKATGPFGYMIKPFEEQQLHTTIEMALYKFKMEKKLRESEKRYELASRAGQVGVWDWNVSNDGFYLDSSLKSMLGYKMGEDISTLDDWMEVIYPDDRNTVKETARKHLDGGSDQYELVHRMFHRNKSVRWFLARGVAIKNHHGIVTRMIGTETDITERRLAEDKLRKLSTAIEQSPVTVMITDVQGKIEYVNPKFTEVSGYTSEEVLGKSPSILKSGNHDADFYEDMWHTILNGNEWRGEFHNRRKDGQLYWELATISPLRSHDGKTTHFLAIKEDITKRKKAETELRRAKEEAEAANRAKSDFLSHMSHELRTPMTAILGFAQLLESVSEESPSERQNDCIKEILNAGYHLMELINEVLDLSSIESGKLSMSIEMIPLEPLIKECIALILPLADQNRISVRESCQNYEDYFVCADKTRLKQILLNLLSNAVKYNKEGGEVKIECRMEGGKFVRICVTDTGEGFPEEQYMQLFEPFKRLVSDRRKSIEGTGIGLSISKNLIQLMGGSLGVESFPGKGSTFWIDIVKDKSRELYKADAYPGEAAAEERKEPEKFTLLYVEDNISNLKLVTQILARRSDVLMITAQTAKLGLELAYAHRPHVILLDIMLPDMDGYEMVKHLRKREEMLDIPIVALSANAMPRDIERGLKAGFAHYLTKPLDIDHFMSVMDEVLSLADREKKNNIF